MVRTAFDVRARIEQDGGTRSGWNRSGQSRPIDARNHPEGEMGRQYRGAGMAGAEERIGFASRDKVRCHPNGRPGLPPRRGRGIGHLDHIRRLDDTDWKLAPVCVALEGGNDCGGCSDKGELKVKVTGGCDGAIHDRGRRMVAAHRINGDCDHS
jgi:hypothetical protein